MYNYITFTCVIFTTSVIDPYTCAGHLTLVFLVAWCISNLKNFHNCGALLRNKGFAFVLALTLSLELILPIIHMYICTTSFILMATISLQLHSTSGACSIFTFGLHITYWIHLCLHFFLMHLVFILKKMSFIVV